MTDKTKYLLILATGLIFNPMAYADNSHITLLVGNCIACHGPNGSSLGPATPTIANLDAENFVDIMEEYKNGERPSTIMGRIAKGYTSEDFEKMAKYFAPKPFIAQKQTFEPDKAKKGSKYHETYCEKCHKKGGLQKNSDGANILAGQWMPYLDFSLADFRMGIRDIPKKMKKRLKKMINKHGEESLEDIVHFYGGQTHIQNNDD